MKSRNEIKNVAIVGGTHGNEVTGTYLLRRWAANPQEIKRHSFDTKLLWANPKAFRENRRYIDCDLNRSFSRDDLKDETIDTYEGNRAKVINALLGPKGNPAFDFTFDIHSTTSNMGITLILIGEDQYQLRLAAYLKARIRNVNLLCIPSEIGEANLSSVTPRMLGIEIGPIPQGLLRHDIFDQVNQVVNLGLDYIELVNAGNDPAVDYQVEVFTYRSTVKFPVDSEGNIGAMIHRDLQDKDFTALLQGDPMFVTLGGEIIPYTEDEIAYPVFINEAAYYDQKIALSLTDRRMTTIALVGTRAETEFVLSRMWAEMLQLEAVGADDNLFELGADSLSALRIISLVQQTFGVELPEVALFESPTISSLCERIMALKMKPDPRAQD